MDREVRQVVEATQAVGAFEVTATVADLPPGIYYCTLQTPTGQVVQKIVVTQ